MNGGWWPGPHLVVVVAVIGAAVATACVPAPPEDAALADVVPDPVLVARDSVVRIRAVGPCAVGVGTGFVIDGRRIVTNRHVVEGAARIDVETWDGRPVGVGAAHQGVETDLAVIDLRRRAARRLQPIALAEEPAAIGSRLSAIGYAEAGPAVVSGGQLIDEKPGRRYLGESGAVLRMSVAVRPGNSGGPVLTPDSEATGVVFAHESRTEYALVIPLQRLRRVLRDPEALEPVRPC